jgi:hypothetical protein
MQLMVNDLYENIISFRVSPQVIRNKNDLSRCLSKLYELLSQLYSIQETKKDLLKIFYILPEQITSDYSLQIEGGDLSCDTIFSINLPEKLSICQQQKFTNNLSQYFNGSVFFDNDDSLKIINPFPLKNKHNISNVSNSVRNLLTEFSRENDKTIIPSSAKIAAAASSSAQVAAAVAIFSSTNVAAKAAFDRKEEKTLSYINQYKNKNSIKKTMLFFLSPPSLEIACPPKIAPKSIRENVKVMIDRLGTEILLALDSDDVSMMSKVEEDKFNTRILITQPSNAFEIINRIAGYKILEIRNESDDFRLLGFGVQEENEARTIFVVLKVLNHVQLAKLLSDNALLSKLQKKAEIKLREFEEYENLNSQSFSHA